MSRRLLLTTKRLDQTSELIIRLFGMAGSLRRRYKIDRVRAAQLADPDGRDRLVGETMQRIVDLEADTGR